MTREETIRIFREEIECLSHTKCKDCILDCDPMQTPTDDEYIEAMAMAIKVLQNNAWHPSSEDPESRGVYLVTRHYGKGDEIEIAHYTDDMRAVDEYDYADTRRGGWYRYDPEYGNYEIDNVVAWMKLPEPYKESEVSE